MAAIKPHLKLKETLMLFELAAYANNVSPACEYTGMKPKAYYQIKKPMMQVALRPWKEKTEKAQIIAILPDAGSLH